MLESLAFKNYKCFDGQTVPFRPSTIVVGRNNAGKSTIVEALRLIALVANRAEHLRFFAPPRWTELHRNQRGVAPSILDLDINFESVFHRYGDPPASVLARFTSGASVQVYLGRERGQGLVHGVVRNAGGKAAQNAGEVRALGIPRIEILPQVAPVSKSETILTAEHVRRNLSTALAPQHFRNQINLLYEYYPHFRAISEETWPGLRIDTFSGHNGNPGDPLKLNVRNDDFVAEISWMGHGLQMWLQTMWFLARSRNAKVVMLDEPDVYMHPDLQRRLIRFLRDRFPQTIVTTHSLAMLSEIDPAEVMVVDRRGGQSAFADSLPAMQEVIDNNLGAVHSVNLSRLWSAKKFLHVEGEDMQILGRFYDLIFPESLDSFAAVPNQSIGGWGGWGYAVGSSLTLHNAGGEAISTYCLLDSDYHTPKEIEDRLKDAADKKVRLHIWSRKEIENYLVVPAAIRRVIAGKCVSPPSIDQIISKLREIAEAVKDDVVDNFADSFRNEDRGKGQQAANRKARELVGLAWSVGEGALHRVSGKGLLSGISEWGKREFGVSFGIAAVLRALRREDLAPEVVGVISAIDANEHFPDELVQ